MPERHGPDKHAPFVHDYDPEHDSWISVLPESESQAGIDEAIRRIQQRLHEHRWSIIGIWRPPHPIHPRIAKEAVTVVLIKCRECGWPETIALAGEWTEEQVRKASDDD